MATSQTFEDWLATKLLSLDPEIDTDVFVMYINGILETEDSSEEKQDSMSEILSEVIPENSSEVCTEILKKWEEFNGETSQRKQEGSEDLASQLSNMLENQKIETVKPKEKISKEAIERKAAILAAYSQVSDGEESEEDRPDDPGGDSADTLLQKNSNAENVTKLEKEKREKSKQEAEKKKEKDKMDREAQKQKQQDRKENEKKRTQKGERRR